VGLLYPKEMKRNFTRSVKEPREKQRDILKGDRKAIRPNDLSAISQGKTSRFMKE
jgi:hypothetical protein